jgi:anti-sigma factor RsiW
MTCREIADFLADYVSGDLPPDVLEPFEHHLRLCPNCRAYLETYRATIEVGRLAWAPDEDAVTEFPEELVAAVLDAVRR